MGSKPSRQLEFESSPKRFAPDDPNAPRIPLHSVLGRPRTTDLTPHPQQRSLAPPPFHLHTMFDAKGGASTTSRTPCADRRLYSGSCAQSQTPPPGHRGRRAGQGLQCRERCFAPPAYGTQSGPHVHSYEGSAVLAPWAARRFRGPGREHQPSHAEPMIISKSIPGFQFLPGPDRKWDRRVEHLAHAAPAPSGPDKIFLPSQ